MRRRSKWCGWKWKTLCADLFSMTGPSSPIIAVSSLTGAGLDELKSALAKVASEVTAKDSAALARLPIDRVFTMKGFGTVVTGTLVAGTIRKEEELEVFPSGKRVRVRGVQVHGSPAEAAIAGQRTALNLAGLSTEDLARGMTLATADTFHSTSRVDALLSLLPSAKPFKDGARVHFHAYTTETIAEARLYGIKQLKPGDEAYAQLRFAEPMLLLPGDRFIVRQFSPVVTDWRRRCAGCFASDSQATRRRCDRISQDHAGWLSGSKCWRRASRGGGQSACAWTTSPEK